MNVDSVRTFIAVEILNDSTVRIAPDDDLLLNGMIDSLGVTRLITFLESETGLMIPPEDVTLENFSTVANIANYMSDRVASAA